METEIKNLNPGNFFTLYPLNYPSDIDLWVLGKYDGRLQMYKIYRYNDKQRFTYVTGEFVVFKVKVTI